MRRIAGIAVAAALLAGPAAAQSRFALVVGNDGYQNVEPLKKAVNDARAVAQSLGRLGFSVTLGTNVARRDFVRMVADFENRIQPGDTAFVFYSGHGVEIEGANYLLPIDVPKVGAGQQGILRDEAISTDGLIQRLKARGTRAQILVLDACRDNPFRDQLGRSVGGARGLAQAQASNGVFVIYSAGIGETALDRLANNDTNPNSVFTRSFLPLLEDSSKSLVEVAKATRLQVKSLAAGLGHQQSPAYYDEVDGDLFLARLDGATPRPAPTLPPVVVATPAPAPVPPPPAPPPVAVPPVASGFIFPDSDRRYLSRDELARLSRDQLRIARNEIYARRNRYFQDASLTAHFSRFAWYRPNTWEPALNAYEKANISLIQSMER
jgi:caspase domain-containing protein/YARHG domain-containing protein